MGDMGNSAELARYHLRVREDSDLESAVIYLHGAHVTSWIPEDGIERLYLSKRAVFQPGKGIRGGVPVIFPQFSTMGSLPRHGFARTTAWTLAAEGQRGAYRFAVFALEDDAAARGIWPHPFRIEYTVLVGGNALQLELRVNNTGSAAFSFQAALHTYLAVGNIENVELDGLNGAAYWDAVENFAPKTQAVPKLRIAGETDRVYLDAPDMISLNEGERTLHIEKTGFPDTVVWNAWHTAAGIGDMEPDDYRRYVCVEAAAVQHAISLEPGQFWEGSQTLHTFSAGKG